MLIRIIILTLSIEALTVICKVMFGSFKDNYKKIGFKYKLRIHHSYIGVVLILIYLFYPTELFFIIGLSLVFSDTIHHFIVLPLWTERTEFP